jgi:hypothetical protein
VAFHETVPVPLPMLQPEMSLLKVSVTGLTAQPMLVPANVNPATAKPARDAVSECCVLVLLIIISLWSDLFRFWGIACFGCEGISQMI